MNFLRYKVARIVGYWKQNGFKKTLYRILYAMARFLPPRLYFRIPEYLIRRIIPGYAIKKVNGFRMFLDLKHDDGVSRDLFFFKGREFASTEYILKSGIIREGDVVLDIGGNIGYYALIESELVGKNGYVYILEPVLQNYQCLKKNLALNNIINAKTFKLAAGDAEGKMVIQVHEKRNLSSFSRVSYDPLRTEEVDMMPMDSFLEDKPCPALARMDVEGFEWKILKGMERTLRKKEMRGLFIEIHPNLMPKEAVEDMFKLLQSAGFTSAVVMGGKDIDPALLTRKARFRPTVRWIRHLKGQEIRDEMITRPNWRMSSLELFRSVRQGVGYNAHFFKE